MSSFDLPKNKYASKNEDEQFYKQNSEFIFTISSTNSKKQLQSIGSDIQAEDVIEYKSEQISTSLSKEDISLYQHMVHHQYEVVIACCAVLSAVMYGIVLSFPSVILTDIKEFNSTIYGTYISLTSTEQDLMGSLTNFGGIVGVVLGGFSNSLLGRRMTIAGTGFCSLISWIGIAFSTNSTMCLAFRFFGGMSYGCGGMTTIAYTVEISSGATRAVFALCCSLFLVVGQVVGVVPSYWLHYYHVCFINCIIPVGSLMLVILVMPESPTFLTIQGREKEARKVLLRLRRDAQVVEAEIESYKKLNEMVQKVNKFQAITQKDVLIKLAIICTIFIEQVFSGYTLYTSQTARVLEDTGNNFETSTATLLVQLSQLLGGITISLFVRRVGRRGSLVISGCISAVAVTTLATYTLFYERYLNDAAEFNSSTTFWDEELFYDTDRIHLHFDDLLDISSDWISGKVSDELPGVPGGSYDVILNNDWIPLFCLMVTQFGLGMGLQNVPFLLASEYFPTAIRPLGASLSNCFGMLVGFACLTLFTPMQEVLSMAGVLYLFASVAALSIPFALFIVQETVGKDVG